MSETQTKARPIILRDWEVRAILGGATLLARPADLPQEWSGPTECYWYAPTKVDRRGEEYPGPDVYGVADDEQGFVSPYGAPGDRLWVKEGWCPCEVTDGERVAAFYAGAIGVAYRADFAGIDDVARWRSPVAMPRWASRLTLTVAEVRVMRVQEITPFDCLLVGVDVGEPPPGCDVHGHKRPERWDDMSEAAKEDWVKGTARAIYFARCADAQNHIDAFVAAWNKDNPKHPFASNPWAWAVTVSTEEQS